MVLSPFRLRLPHSTFGALGLLVASSIVRSFGALAAVVLAGGLGTGVKMDQYMSFSLAVVTACALLSIAVPSLLARYSTAGGEAAIDVGRAWARKLGNVGALAYLASVPALAWSFLPVGSDGYLSLCGLMALGVGAVWAAPRVAVEQTAHQYHGRPYFAMSGTALCMGAALLGAVGSMLTVEVAWAAAALSLGACAELLWLRRGASHGAVLRGEKAVAALPLREFFVFTLAAAGAFIVGLIDQALLARLGSSAQAVWGLASKPAAFLSMSVFAVAATLSTRVLMAPGCPAARALAVRRLALGAFAGTAGVLGLLWLVATPFTALLYERGAFGADDTALTAQVLVATLWTYLLYPATAVLVRAVSAQADYRRLLRATGAFVVVKVATAVWWLPSAGYWAVALSSLAAMLVQGACLWKPALKTARPGTDRVSNEATLR